MHQIALEECRRRANLGEPGAQLELAWEYYRGDVVPKDIDAAIALLRQLELKAPELARFNLAKMKYLEGDNSFVDDIRGDCAAGFGPALYLMGVYSNQKVGEDTDLKEAIGYFRAAERSGHLPSEFQVWRLSNLSFWQRLTTAIPAYRTFVRMIAIRWHDIDDTRILT